MKILDNAGNLAGTVLSIVETRFELFGLEIRQERNRATLLVALTLLGCNSFLLMWVSLFVLLAVALPAGVARITVLSICLGSLALVTIGCLVGVLLMVRSVKLPLHETREEIKKDLQCLTSALKNKTSER